MELRINRVRINRSRPVIQFYHAGFHVFLSFNSNRCFHKMMVQASIFPEQTFMCLTFLLLGWLGVLNHIFEKEVFHLYCFVTKIYVEFGKRLFMPCPHKTWMKSSSSPWSIKWLRANTSRSNFYHVSNGPRQNRCDYTTICIRKYF